MTMERFLGRLAARAAAVALAVGYAGLAVAADEPIRLAPAAPAGPVVTEVCPTCTDGAAAAAPCGKDGCSTCGKAGHRAGCNPPKPIAGQLRPGACFGYFQTQWHRWEDVCPLPYQGVGLNDAPRRLPTVGGGLPAVGAAAPRSDAPAPAVNPMLKGTGTPAPAPGTVPPPPMQKGAVQPPMQKGAGTPAPTHGSIPPLPIPPVPGKTK